MSLDRSRLTGLMVSAGTTLCFVPPSAANDERPSAKCLHVQSNPDDQRKGPRSIGGQRLQVLLAPLVTGGRNHVAVREPQVQGQVLHGRRACAGGQREHVIQA